MATREAAVEAIKMLNGRLFLDRRREPSMRYRMSHGHQGWDGGASSPPPEAAPKP